RVCLRGHRAFAVESRTWMESYQSYRDGQNNLVVKVPFRGRELLCHPMYNKGSAFTPDERRALGLEGLLPSRIGTLDEQVRRKYASIARKADPLEKYIGLSSLQDRNEILFY